MNTATANKQTTATETNTGTNSSTFSIEFNSEYVFIDCDTWEDGKAFKTEAVLELLGLSSPDDIVNRLPEEARHNLLT
ncbi:MAG: hypothetical protein C0603_06700 [Denitrovibrio sp.]|nr:MAG: hypothetical protein C0603_06700 [Denitrovibrio sp.]